MVFTPNSYTPWLNAGKVKLCSPATNDYMGMMFEMPKTARHLLATLLLTLAVLPLAAHAGDARFDNALALYEEGRFEEAEDALLEFVGQTGGTRLEHARAFALLGFLGVNRGETVQAEVYLEKALELAPDDPKVLSHYGVSMYTARKYDKAYSALLRCYQIAPDAYVHRLCERARMRMEEGVPSDTAETAELGTSDVRRPVSPPPPTTPEAPVTPEVRPTPAPKAPREFVAEAPQSVTQQSQAQQAKEEASEPPAPPKKEAKPDRPAEVPQSAVQTAPAPKKAKAAGQPQERPESATPKVPPTPVKKVETPAPAPAGQRAEPAPEHRFHTVQLAAYRDAKLAKAKAAEFASKGVGVNVYRTETNSGGTWFKVLTGRFENLDEAKAHRLDVIEKTGQNGAWATRITVREQVWSSTDTD